MEIEKVSAEAAQNPQPVRTIETDAHWLNQSLARRGIVKLTTTEGNWYCGTMQ